MTHITWHETKAWHTNRPRHVASVPVHECLPDTVRHLAFIHRKNDDRWEVTMKRVKESDVFRDHRWKPTFDQRVFVCLQDAKTAVEACWDANALGDQA